MRWPIVALFAASVAVPLLMLAVAGVLSYRQVEAEAFTRAERAAEILRGHALQSFRAQELTITLLREFLPELDWRSESELKRVQHRLKQIVDAVGDIASIHLARKDGLQTVSNRGSYGIDVRERDYFKAVQASDQLFVSSPAVGLASGARVFSMASRLSDPGGDFAGAIVVSVGQASFEGFYQGLLQSPDADAIGLIRSDGTVLVRAPGLAEPAKLPPTSGLMTAVRSDPAGGRFVSVAVIDGVERLYCYRKVGPYPVYVSYAVASSTVFWQWVRSMSYFAAMSLAAALALLLASAVALRTARRADLAKVELAVQAGRRAEAEAAEAEAEKAVRLRDHFIATLSHELRNPMSAILNSIELARRRPADPGLVTSALDVARRQSGQMKRLLDDLLDSARIARGRVELQVEDFDAVPFARRVCADHHGDVANRISIGGEPTRVRADPTRLEQMLLNLVGNAFDSGAKHVAIDIARNGPFATVTVRDDGRGLSPEQLAGLFDPSASVSPTGGLGLGLSIVASLARLHGGSIEASSAGPGRGATFLLRLPLAGAGAIDGGPAK